MEPKWWGYAARAEIDARAREARLRLEHIERLLPIVLRVSLQYRDHVAIDRLDDQCELLVVRQNQAQQIA